jgi:hypothetical protein
MSLMHQDEILKRRVYGINRLWIIIGLREGLLIMSI